MKIYETKETNDQILEEALSDADQETLEIEEAYEELHMLREVMETADFGLLIGENQTLTREKLPLVHGKINLILRRNRILQESGLGWDYDGRSVLKSLGKRVSLSLNGIFGVTISGLLGWLAIAGSLTTPITAIAAGAASLFAIAGLTNNKALKSFKKASEVVAISDLVAQSKPINQSTKRSEFQRFWDDIRGKTPQELQQEAQRRAQKNAKKAGDQLEKAVSEMPEFIPYVKDNGKIGRYEVWKFFDSEFIPPEEG